MVIKISGESHKLKFWIPTRLIKLKFVYKQIFKDSNLNAYNIGKLIYKELRKYIKNFGHFTLVDIISDDGTKITIKV